MDLATISGLVMGFALMIIAIMLGGDIGMFINPPSLLIVIGGTFSHILVKYKMSDVFATVGIMMNAFVAKTHNAEQVIGQLIDMANIARKDGILALERVKSDDPFLQGAVNHCVDGADPEFLEEILYKELEYQEGRHQKGIAQWDAIGEAAPAFGMIGTLIGLVQMLATMDAPSAFGPAMAVALLTTLYGSVIANLMAIPIAGKLQNYSDEEMLLRQIIIDGMIGIQKGVNPRMLQEALKAALPPRLRDID